MNIKFGMDNFYVKYLKRFLNNELQQNSSVLGEFDRNDLTALIKYLNLPNVKNMFEVQKLIVEEFPELNTYFNIKLQNNTIKWTSKEISKEASNFILNNLDNIKQFCYNQGWQVLDIYDWVDENKDINSDGVIDDKDLQILYDIVYNKNTSYSALLLQKADINLDGVIDSKDIQELDNYIQTGKLTLTIQQLDRKNYFPNNDMKVFVNQFMGSFLYGYALRDGLGITDKPHYNATGLYKIALYQCTPGQKITIAHNNNKTTHLVIGCSYNILKQNITNDILTDVVEIDLKPGQGYQYTCSSVENGGYNAHWVCIQCPSNYADIATTGSKTVILNVGDINFDGKIDMQDYKLLASYTAKGPGSEQLHWTPTAKQLAVMNVDERDTTINNYDAVRLYNFIQGDPTIPSLGTVAYTYNVETQGEMDNVSNFLIIDGHYDDDVNIPFMDFVKDDWVVHSKFFNYLLGMAIHPYSNSEDISYLQKLLKEYYPEYTYNEDVFYPGNYNNTIKQLVKNYQTSKINYTLGDLNRDNKLTYEDLTMLRQYLDDKKDLDTITDYLDSKITLTPAQLALLDVNKDGVVDSKDKDVLTKQLNKKYSSQFRYRADVNQDGYVNETDYEILKRNIEGYSTSLKQYDITFMLGWCDVPTENLLELDYNISGNISEVSK